MLLGTGSLIAAAVSVCGVHATPAVCLTDHVAEETLGNRPPDLVLRQNIDHRLSSHDVLGQRGIQVEVHDGRVTLRGLVGSAFEKTHAYFLATVPGVIEIDNRLEVVGDTSASDDELRTQVERELDRDPRLRGGRPKVAVRAGVVTLSGLVQDHQAKEAASDAARQIAGVQAVRNHLAVVRSEEGADPPLP